MKRIPQTVTLLLCIGILGIFANFAQNDYGVTLVGYCCMGIGALLLFMSYKTIEHKKGFNISLLLVYALLLGLIVFDRFPIPSIITGVSIVIIMFYPTLILPLMIKRTERKKEEKNITIAYYEYVFIAYFCLGLSMKALSVSGASSILVAGFFLVIPYLSASMRLIRKSIKQRNLNHFLDAAMYLFIVFNLDAFIFMRMHWRGGKGLANISFISFGIMLLCLIIIKLRKHEIITWWNAKRWLNRTAVITFFISSLYYIMMSRKLAPKIYSNYFPQAWQYLDSKSNVLTKEGIEFDKRSTIYMNNYRDFIDNRGRSQ